MRILIVRHGDPDYTIDNLTEKGKREVQLLADRMVKEDMTYIYVSPLGRAQATAQPTLERLGRTAETKEWLKEFPLHMYDEEVGRDRPVWDWLPGKWADRPAFYDADRWYLEPEMEAVPVKDEYLRVCGELDKLLAQHGYVREDRHYRVKKPNRDTLVFFCHFGLECVLLSHMLNISPMPLWHGTCAAPTSVTTVYTEERRPSIACFRMASFGDISHLYTANEPPAFSGRFCETNDCAEERHD